MIIFLLLIASLNAFQGASSPLSAPRDVTDLLSRDVVLSEEMSTEVRTTYEIVRSCLLTIFACVWTSGHPNIAGPRDAGWTRLKRRVVMMIYSLIAPEMMVFWAMRQYAAAGLIAKDYNREFFERNSESDEDSSEQSTWRMSKVWLSESFWQLVEFVKEWWTILPESTAKRVEGQPWTQTHGFFIQMGGFLLYEHGDPKRVLEYDDLKTLIKKGNIDVPTLTESDIQDRSKGDAISKGFVVFQTTWFMVQCITRVANGLPLAELEVVTLGFAVLNAIVYAMWWNKPQGIEVAVCIPLRVKNEEDGEEWKKPMDAARQMAQNFIPFFSPWNLSKGEAENKVVEEHNIEPDAQESYDHMDDELVAQLLTENDPKSNNTQVPPHTTDIHTTGWLGRQILKDRLRYRGSWFIFLARIPYRWVQFVLRPLAKMGNSDTVLAGALRVPMFYADSRAVLSTAYLASCIIGVIFGIVHLFAWSSRFPSWIEHALWRISAVIITIVPAITIMGMPSFVSLGRIRKRKGFRRFSKSAKFMQVAIPAVLGTPFYIIARFTLLALALISLRDLPTQVHASVSWTSFIPHL